MEMQIRREEEPPRAVLRYEEIEEPKHPIQRYIESEEKLAALAQEEPAEDMEVSGEFLMRLTQLSQHHPAPVQVPAQVAAPQLSEPNQYGLNFSALSSQTAEIDRMFDSKITPGRQHLAPEVPLERAFQVAQVVDHPNSFRVTFQGRDQTVALDILERLHEVLTHDFYYRVLPSFPKQGVVEKHFWPEKNSFQRAAELEVYLNKLMVTDEVRKFIGFQLFAADAAKFGEFHATWRKGLSQEGVGWVEAVKRAVKGLAGSSQQGVFAKQRTELGGFLRFLRRQLDHHLMLKDATADHIEYSSEVTQVLLQVQQRGGLPRDQAHDHLRTARVEERRASLDALVRAIKNLMREVMSCVEAIDRADHLFMEYARLSTTALDSATPPSPTEDIDRHTAYLRTLKVQEALGGDLHTSLAGIALQVRALFGDAYPSILRQLAYQV